MFSSQHTSSSSIHSTSTSIASYSISVQSHQKPPLTLTNSSSRSRRKPSNPQRFCESPEILPPVPPPSPIPSHLVSAYEVVAKKLNSDVPLSKKKKSSTVPDELKTPEYWARREKNNESAKKSRQAKKAQSQWIDKEIVKSPLSEPKR